MGAMAEENERYSKYEKARMIGSRALQIAMGAPFLLKMSDEDLHEVKFNPIEIARREYNEGVIPITVRRPLPVRRVAAEEEDVE